MAVTAPKWESKLWSYLDNSNGARCPVYARCRIRRQGGWCLDDHKRYVDRLVDSDYLNVTDYKFIRYVKFGIVFKLAEMLAYKYLRMGGVHCPPVPNEVVTLADREHPVEVHQLPLKACHGAIWRINGRWVIILKEDDTAAAKRLTLFHEAFHIIAHCKANPVFRHRNSPGGAFNELLANHFAMFLLMPAGWVGAKWAECRELQRMADIFQVPESLMCIRLLSLGLL